MCSKGTDFRRFGDRDYGCGVCIAYFPATIRWYEPRFSYVYFHPIGEVVISGVIWLAGTLFAEGEKGDRTRNSLGFT